ncbi:condensin subunit Smc [Nitrosomonas cryotolerans]|uniref:Chromosome partition protein Smc n=1 Tax=Nitrosomonas cryotolerans ATCC 49181 TaxID=1131553 RepID=A0A1N6IRR1_9PROT|nr:chromosome segregation protein SMC [Nitrosomonas cryotolerans]SFP33880.1 condensin subunit Smc [Nitrosomonas cryotolerans]SIO34644.1 condensin subunit Smc [Nitrosomonas cryotolerans ATCC 49181]
MRLSQIKLAGFKSFVDPTIISTPGNLVGIVGPNGCGKSNVIDAVRWVLGESKASALRGESMQDVIFSGSANRKPVGRASVELIFDNKLGRAIGQWSSYAEIAIKRVIQRDGASAYYINNTHVRRRDIADIFLGTGVGGRGYAIIEQGMISRIIEAKPHELRLFLEEAAGISKYRERRHETELRLADTRKNLLRLEDIYQELSTQRQHLEEQAKAAKQLKETQIKLQTAQNLLWLLRKQEAVTKQVYAENEIHRREQELETERARLSDLEKKLETVRFQHSSASEQLQQSQDKLHAVNASVIYLEQEIAHLRKNNERLSHQILEAEKQLERNELQVKSATDSLAHWHKEIDLAHSVHQSSMDKNTNAHDQLPTIEAAFRLAQENLNDYQRNLLLIEQASHLEKSHYEHADKSAQQLKSRHDRLIQEQNALPQPDYEKLVSLQKEIENLNMIQGQKKNMLAETEGQALSVIENKKQAAKEVLLLEQALTQMKARFDALQRLQLKLENNAALTAWLTKYKFDALPRLWQHIEIEKNWENALESILREQLNSIGFDQLDVLQSWEHDLPPGKWTLFETEQPSVYAANSRLAEKTEETTCNVTQWKLLRDHIICTHSGIKSVLDEWLSQIYVTENLQEGLLQRIHLVSGEKLVTSQGHIFTRYSLTFYTPDSQLHGVLARQQELNLISAEINQLNINLNQQQSKLAKTECASEKLDETIKRLHSDSKQLQQRQHNLQLEAVKLSQLTERVDQRHTQINNELKEITQQSAMEILQKQDAEIKINQYIEQLDELKKQVEQKNLASVMAEQLLATQRQLVQNTMKEMQEAGFYLKTCESKINELEQNIRIYNENISRSTKDRDQLLAEQSSLDETSLEAQLQESLAKRIRFEQIVAEVRERLNNATRYLQEIDNSRIVSEQKLQALRESINQVRLKEQEACITASRFDEQLNEAKADEKDLLPLIDNLQPSMLQADIKRLNAEIMALGAVNLAALDELLIAQTREANLGSQLRDLNAAVSILEKVIHQIDHETRECLLTTFNSVNNNLDEIFPVMFGGGQAKLILNDGGILDSGITLTAQPPGKRNSSIHLLSGGEKALTALSLIFSLFQLNPAPFCLLDEVDAPLDDSNTDRFCDLVKKISKQTQFLFISHNKITMEMAQQLLGITMQEQGVSRVVAVDVTEAIELGSEVNASLGV